MEVAGKSKINGKGKGTKESSGVNVTKMHYMHVRRHRHKPLYHINNMEDWGGGSVSKVLSVQA